LAVEKCINLEYYLYYRRIRANIKDPGREIGKVVAITCIIKIRRDLDLMNALLKVELRAY
jgi:hypothetical protein